MQKFPFFQTDNEAHSGTVFNIIKELQPIQFKLPDFTILIIFFWNAKSQTVW